MGTLLLENWDRIVLAITSLLGSGGFLVERGKRKRDNRQSDKDYFDSLLESQDRSIDKLTARIDALENRNELLVEKIRGLEEERTKNLIRMSDMQVEIEDLRERLEKYEPKKPKKQQSV